MASIVLFLTVGISSVALPKGVGRVWKDAQEVNLGASDRRASSASSVGGVLAHRILGKNCTVLMIASQTAKANFCQTVITDTD